VLLQCIALHTGSKKDLFIHPFIREELLGSSNAINAPGEISGSMLNLKRHAFGLWRVAKRGTIKLRKGLKL